jgi:hypothetical protein
MKASKSTISEIANKIIIVCNHFDLNLCEKPTVGELWRYWHWIHEEIAYADDHPRFEKRVRLLSYDHSHTLYPDNTNDKTMTTALRAAYTLARSII